MVCVSVLCDCGGVGWDEADLITDKLHTAILTRFYDFTILQFYDFTILRFYDFTILRFFDFSILRFYDECMNGLGP